MHIKPLILLDNDEFIVLNKPSGMLSIPDRTQSQPSLKDMLLEQYSSIFTVHRLDKDTSGVIVFAKTECAHKELSELFEGRLVEKLYLGLVRGIVLPESGSVDAAIMGHPGKNGKMVIHQKGKPSLTDYEVIEQFRLYAWLKFNLHTGRTHQIRLHMEYKGHPIVCDELYGSADAVYVSFLKRNYHLSKKEENEKPILKRLALHAHQLKFQLNNKPYSFEAPIPKDLSAVLQQLRKWNALA